MSKYDISLIVKRLMGLLVQSYGREVEESWFEAGRLESTGLKRNIYIFATQEPFTAQTP